MAAISARTGALNKVANKAAQRPVAAVRRAVAVRASAEAGMAFNGVSTPFDNYKFAPIKEATVSRRLVPHLCLHAARAAHVASYSLQYVVRTPASPISSL